MKLELQIAKSAKTIKFNGVKRDFNQSNFRTSSGCR
jgi:hypothetical protein